MSLVYRDVTGRYLNVDGSPKYGYIEFTPSIDMVSAGEAILPLHTVTMYLDPDGYISGSLACTDSPGVIPTGWLWSVEEKVENGTVWWMTVPQGAGSYDIIANKVPGLAPPAYAVEGTPGKSAYQIWLDEGNTGTEEDFLASLEGTDGEPGPMGPPGWSNAVFSAIWRWVTKTTDANAVGQIGNNNSSTTWAATQLNINKQRDDNGDTAFRQGKLIAGDQIRVAHKTDATRYAVYTLTGPGVLTGGNYFAFPVTLDISSGTEPAGNTEVWVSALSQSQDMVLQIDAKGDTLVGDADNSVARLPVGTDGQVYTADSSQPTGVKWADPTGGGGGGGTLNSLTDVDTTLVFDGAFLGYTASGVPVWIGTPTTITEHGHYDSDVGANVWDNNQSTFWNTGDVGSGIAWTVGDFGTAKAVASIFMKATTVQRDWYLYGSNDGSAWTLIGGPFAATVAGKAYSLGGVFTYRYFKFQTTAGDGSWTDPSDFTLYAPIPAQWVPIEPRRNNFLLMGA